MVTKRFFPAVDVRVHGGELLLTGGFDEQGELFRFFAGCFVQ